MTPDQLNTKISTFGPVGAAVLAGIHADSGEADPWSEASFASTLGMPGAATIVVSLDDRPACFCLYRKAADEMEIILIVTKLSFRRRGLARRALEAAIRSAAAERIFLEVAEGNEAARSLYASAGFAKVGRRTGYYADGQNALVMARDWKPRA
ncbi:MAG: GNAT family N-acetyltransferase [Magnetovibrionaceae bacterium]